MRGRTLDNSFIILDEAQNTTMNQMKMFLTRLGYGSRAVITGDVTQIDLPSGKSSGLKEIQKVLKDVQGVSFCYFTPSDVVRHPLVQRVIDAFEKYEEEQEAAANRRQGAGQQETRKGDNRQEARKGADRQGTREGANRQEARTDDFSHREGRPAKAYRSGMARQASFPKGDRA
jgi:phosphate starvation-inducible PhoH-like protein